MRTQVMTMDKAVHSMFFRVAETKRKHGQRVQVELDAVADPDVHVLVDMPRERAAELGLLAA